MGLIYVILIAFVMYWDNIFGKIASLFFYFRQGIVGTTQQRQMSVSNIIVLLVGINKV